MLIPERLTQTRASRFRSVDDVSLPSSLAPRYAEATGRGEAAGLDVEYINIASRWARCTDAGVRPDAPPHRRVSQRDLGFRTAGGKGERGWSRGSWPTAFRVQRDVQADDDPVAVAVGSSRKPHTSPDEASMS